MATPSGRLTRNRYDRGGTAIVEGFLFTVALVAAPFEARAQPYQYVLTYDPRMRLTIRSVGTEATVFGYDPVGQMASVTLPDNASLTYTYDAAHRLTAINDHKGNRVDYTLDAMGNRINEQIKDPGGVLVQNIARVIDALNRGRENNRELP